MPCPYGCTSHKRELLYDMTLLCNQQLQLTCFFNESIFGIFCQCISPNNIESIESTVIESTETTVIVEISSQTDELVETEMAGETDEVKRETKALIEALKRRAQAEAKSADTLTRETYLNAVRQAREAIENCYFTLDPKNWKSAATDCYTLQPILLHWVN